jgi:DNA polymerase III sliding clamp (beta) subunit (PCNA family)
MTVDIPIDDLSCYSIVEGEEILLTYSLGYINKMCITNKLSNDIEFYLGNDMPMKINYNLGDDSYIMFFIAPKIND